MKNVGTILAALFVIFVLALYMCTFQVRFTEVAIRKTWGRPARQAITEPGLKLKWPSPIQSVVVFDKRLRILEDRTEETRTAEGKNLLVTSFTLWRIKDPNKFDTSFPGGVDDGEQKLRTTVVTHKHAVIGKHELNDFISTDPRQRKLREIEQDIQSAVAEDASAEYGIEVVDFGIKKLGLPQAITTSIFSAMKENEERRAAIYIAEGDAQAEGIVANAKATEGRIMAAAREKVAQVEAEAQQKVSEYYKEFDRHPELRIFLDKLGTIAKALQERTTLILDDEESPWDVFDEAARARVPLEGPGLISETALLGGAGDTEDSGEKTD